MCGAERVRDETRALFRRKYGMDILEGYGVTEASPVVAANQIEANHPGTVGRLMAGMEARLEPVEGIPNAGRLFVKGPNVMLGYIRPDAPGRDRAAGGRLVRYRRCRLHRRRRLHRHPRPPEALRQDRRRDGVAGGGGKHRRGAVARQSPCRRGRARRPQGRADRAGDRCARKRAALDLVGWAQNHGVSELAVPRRILVVDAIPVLGTGKTDYVAVQKAVAAEARPGWPD